MWDLAILNSWGAALLPAECRHLPLFQGGWDEASGHPPTPEGISLHTKPTPSATGRSKVRDNYSDSTLKEWRNSTITLRQVLQKDEVWLPLPSQRQIDRLDAARVDWLLGIDSESNPVVPDAYATLNPAQEQSWPWFVE